jgi:putative DNA primase/helicase
VLPDPEVRGFLHRLAGVGLLGVVVEQVLGILTGTGANGKGVFYAALGHALGDYATVAEPDLFMHREGAHPTGEMDLRGVRWVVVSESERDRRLAEATMKRLTGGDKIKARRMRQDFVRFMPSHTPILVTNHLPKVSGDDPALWRRMRVVPFNVVIPEPDRDPHLPEQLQLEADAVLSWAVAGYRDYVERGGLADPKAVRVATDNYQRDSDAVRRFIAECCFVNPHMHATTGDLFERWSRWATEDGAEVLSRKAFGQSLDRLRFPAGPGGRAGRQRQGIGLAAENTEDDE